MNQFITEMEKALELKLVKKLIIIVSTFTSSPPLRPPFLLDKSQTELT